MAAIAAYFGCTAPVRAQDSDDEADQASEDGDADEEPGDGYEPFTGEQREHTVLRFDIHAMLGYYAEVGGGLRVDIPLIRSGILDALDDDLSLTLGAEILYFYYDMYTGLGVYPVLAFQWNFYISESWSIFPEIGATLVFAPHRERFYPSFIAPHAMLGVRWHISVHNTLFVRAGWPEGVQLGLTFSF